MSRLTNTGLVNSTNNNLVIDINQTYFSDSSFNFGYFVQNGTSSGQTEHPSFSGQSISPGLWLIQSSAQFTNSPYCSIGIWTNATNSGNYGTGSNLFTPGTGTISIDPSSPSGSNFISWNGNGARSSGSGNGTSTSAVINVPNGQTNAVFGINVYNQTSGANFYVFCTYTRIGPPV
jgi:hypothetical protein